MCIPKETSSENTRIAISWFKVGSVDRTHLENGMANMDQEFIDYRIEQATAYLEKVRKMAVRLISLNANIEEQKAIASGLTGIDYSRDIVSTSPTDDKMPNCVWKILQLVDDLEALHDEYDSRIRMALSAIERMKSSECAAAIEMHYIAGKDWASVAAALGYTKPGMMTLRKRALNEFYDVMPLTQRDPIPEAI